VEWLLRLAELRLLAARWQVATVHLEGKGMGSQANGIALAEAAGSSEGPVDVVLGYRNPRKIKRLAALSGGWLRVVDGSSAYFRLQAGETEPVVLYQRLKDLLQSAPPSV
jgi:hypothetical protein